MSLLEWSDLRRFKDEYRSKQPLLPVTHKDFRLRSKFNNQLPNARLACLKHIFKHVECTTLLNHLSDVFYLEGQLGADRHSDEKWNDVLNENQLQELKESKVVVIAFALVTEHLEFVEMDIECELVPFASYVLRKKIKEYFDDAHHMSSN